MPVSSFRPALALGLLVLAAGCRQAAVPTAPADEVLPHDTFTLQSAAVGEERRINVYLPPGYGETDRAFPVLYMPDGGVQEDFPHLTNTVDALVREGAIAPVLVVGIENTQRRRDLTPPTTVASDREIAPVVGGSAAFRTFIRTELIPEIERRYRVTGERAIVGESLAGLFIMETALTEPALFGRYIAMSPSLWWDDHRLADQSAALVPGLAGRTLWFTAADEDNIYPHTDRLAALLERQAPAGLRWRYDPRRDEEHGTIFRATEAAAFRWALWGGEAGE